MYYLQAQQAKSHFKSITQILLRQTNITMCVYAWHYVQTKRNDILSLIVCLNSLFLFSTEKIRYTMHVENTIFQQSTKYVRTSKPILDVPHGVFIDFSFFLFILFHIIYRLSLRAFRQPNIIVIP